tara:strand:+ start:879 stop:1652 length:774 start_codon:yes stop_codon:yes gene_type:complete
MQNSEKNFFIKNGFLKIKLQQNKFLYLKNKIRDTLKKELNLKQVDLEKFHTKIKIEKLNNLRLKFFKKINEDENFKKNAYLSAKKYIHEAVGNELCSSDTNLSIQLPNDKSSLLEMHSDFFSGESLFQINLWIPFVNVKRTQSMFIINPSDSLKILKKIKYDRNLNFNDINKKYKDKKRWINLKLGEAILFSPNCLHGNVINLEKNTRWSVNIRYKNIYSPYGKERNEKKIGSFYNLITPKTITQFNLKYDFDEIIN